MAKLGKKWSCFSCATKFYDFEKAEAVCPKCGTNQKASASKVKAAKKTKTALDIDDDHSEQDEALDEVALGDSPLEPEKEGIDPGGLKMDDYDE